MKKHKVTRLLALALSTVMLFSLTACGGQKEEKTDQKGQEEQEVLEEQEASESQEESAGESEVGGEKGDGEMEPITLTLGTKVNFWSLGDGIFTDSQPVLQYIKEKTGIEIDFISFDDDKYTVMLAGGDIPDICVGFENDIPGLVSSGQILELDSLLEQYGSNIVNKQPVAMASAKIKYGNNEHYYCIPTRVSIPGSTPAAVGDASLRLRYDVWKAIGSPEYETVDELIDVLKQMQDYQREQTGDNTIYGLTLCMRNDIWNFNVGMIGLGYSGGNALLPSTNYITGETTIGPMDPEGPFWEVAEFFNKAYRAGILDPESMTQDVNTFMSKTSDGKVMGTLDWFRNMNYEADAVGEDAIMVCLPFGPFKTIQGIYGSAVPTGGGSNLFISSKCEYPERAMQLLDLLWSDEGLRTIFNGIQGENWDYDENGAPVFIGEVADAYSRSLEEGGALKEETSLGEEGLYWISGGFELQSLDGYPIEIYSSEDFRARFTSGAAHKFAQDYGHDYVGQVYAEWEQEGLVTTDSHAIEVTTVLGMMKTLSDDTAMLSADVAQFWTSMLPEVVLAESEEDFQAAKAATIEGMEEIGMQTVIDEYLQNKAEAQADYEAMLAE